jgi:transmembrane sensor
MKNLKIPFEISECIFRQLKDEANKQDKLMLQKWLNENPSNKELYDKITNTTLIEKKLMRYEKYNKDKAWQNILEQKEKPAHNKKIRLQKIIRYAAAILIPVMIGSYFLFRSSLFDRDNMPVISEKIVPGTQKAVLTLGNGEKIMLNNTERKTITAEKKVNITDAGNMVKYIPLKKEGAKAIIYNTLETPRGGEYSIVLSDGTRIRLNAASKLRFPVTFPDKERRVYIEGEAYFEVTKNKTSPFVVITDQMEITVLGTSFNVMAYKEEDNIETTLVEGMVKIKSGNNGLENTKSIEINPGEQAFLVKETQTLGSRKVNTKLYTAWKDGKLIFSNEPLDVLMRRLERWYNFETKYSSPEIKNYHFSGTLDRYQDFSGILEMISMTTSISFEIKNNVVYVTSKK